MEDLTMTRFIDTQNRVLEITMIDTATNCPWEYDFFEIGQLDRHPEEEDAYMVEDIMYLIDEATEYCKESTQSTCDFNWYMLK